MERQRGEGERCGGVGVCSAQDHQVPSPSRVTNTELSFQEASEEHAGLHPGPPPVPGQPETSVCVSFLYSLQSTADLKEFLMNESQQFTADLHKLLTENLSR